MLIFPLLTNTSALDFLLWGLFYYRVLQWAIQALSLPCHHIHFLKTILTLLVEEFSITCNLAGGGDGWLYSKATSKC